jgi:aromatic-L-amino-acid decarboxylase
MANFHAIVVARQDKLKGQVLKGVIYGSTHTHHSIWKGAFAAGIPRTNHRIIEVENDGKINLHKLTVQIEKDRDNGLIPFLIVGNGGTTSCGRVDDLSELKKISEKNNLWFHVDGAYGGFFCLTAKGKKILKGIEQSDSLTLDPHKGLFLPYGTGALLVNNGIKLNETFTEDCSYIQGHADDSELWDFSSCSLELSREMRGMRIYLPIKKYGVNIFKKALNEKIGLSQNTFKKLSKYKLLQLMQKPDLTVINFRCEQEDNLENRNEKTLELIDFINKKNNVHLSGTYLGEVFYIRICILSFRTHKDDIDKLFMDIDQFMNMKVRPAEKRRSE